jgi:hypothetical protein
MKCNADSFRELPVVTCEESIVRTGKHGEVNRHSLQHTVMTAPKLRLTKKIVTIHAHIPD